MGIQTSLESQTFMIWHPWRPEELHQILKRNDYYYLLFAQELLELEEKTGSSVAVDICDQSLWRLQVI